MSVWRFRVTLAVGLMLAVDLAGAQTFPVDDVSPLADNAQLMSTAVDANGNAMVLWSVQGPTGAQLAVRSSRYDIATDTWGAPADLIRLPNQFDPQYQLQLVMLPTGDALAIGRAIYGTQYGAQAVVYARYAVSTGTWGAITTLSPPGVDWPLWPSVVADANGVVTAVWEQDCSGCKGLTLHAARYSPATGTWTAPQALEGGLFAATYNFDPIAGIDANGNVVVAFSKNNGADQTIYAKRYSVNAATWEGTEAIAPSACDHCGDNALAVDSSGNALVTWKGKSGLLESVLFNAATGLWGGVQTVSPSAAQSPGIAADANGNFVVTWTTPFSSVVKPSFLTRRFSSTSGTWGPVTTLSDNGYWGRVVMDRSGNATAVWNHNGTPSGFKGARFDAAADSWSGAIDLAASTAASAVVSPVLAVDAAGNVRVSWQRYPPTGSGVRVVQSMVWPAGAGPATGPPSAPTNVRATVSGNTVSLTWSAPSTGAAPTGYTLIGRTALGGPVLATLPMGAGTSFSVAAPNGTFVITATASNASGTSPESSPVTVTVPQAATQPPGAPGNLAATVSGTTANFTWTASANGGPVESYVLVAGLTPAFGAPIATLPLGPSASVSVQAVPPGTYYVRVLATNALGTSAPSNEISVTVASPSAPGAPSLNPPQVSGATVTLSWSPGSGGAPTGYTLMASTTPGGAPIATVPVAGSSVSFTDVPNGTYHVRVTASNTQGTSAPSAEVTLTVGPPTAGSLVPLINAWRARAGVAPLVEEPSWSAGAALHGKYVLFSNESGQSESFHEENPQSSYFTVAGNDAARNSIVFHSLFYANYPADKIISSWARSPFVSVQMLDPQLQRTGIGYVSRNEPSGNGVYRTGAVLDVVRGRNAATPLAAPVTFPRDGGTIVGECPERNGYTACGSAGVLPFLDFCGIHGNGFTTPEFGMPVWIQFGGSVTPVVSAVSLTRAGTAVSVCTLTADTYTVATAEFQTLGRRILQERGAVVLVPRSPLPTGTYTASVTANGKQHHWTFTVQ